LQATPYHLTEPSPIPGWSKYITIFFLTNISLQLQSVNLKSLSCYVNSLTEQMLIRICRELFNIRILVLHSPKTKIFIISVCRGISNAGIAIINT
jgi:hypothetical protein